MYCFSVCVRYEQYVEDAYVAFLKQKGQAEQVSTITPTPVRLEYKYNTWLQEKSHLGLMFDKTNTLKNF